MADVFPTKGLPGMDANNGGTGVGYADTLAKAADFADRNKVETIVNGHFETTTTRADLREYIQYVRDFVRTVQEGKKAGKSVDEATAAFTVDKYPGYKNERVKAAMQTVFDEMKK